MESLVWRQSVQTVASVDIVVTFLSSILAIFMLFGYSLVEKESVPTEPSVMIESLSNNTVQNFSRNPWISFRIDDLSTEISVSSEVFRILCILLMICIVVIGLLLLAAIKLLIASTIGENPKTSLRLATFWRNVNVVLFILFVGANVAMVWIWGLAIGIIWRGLSIYIVYRYVEELKHFVKLPEKSLNSQPDDLVDRETDM